jgi:HK97 family phage major capsid protein
VAENDPITEGEGMFDKLTLSPKTIGTLSQFSRNMLMQATPDIEMLIRQDMAAQLALGIDLAALAGTGINNQPTGILNTNGISYVVGGTNGAQLNIDHLINMATDVELGNADGNSMAFLLNAASVGWLSKIKSTTGEYLWSRDEGSVNRAPLGGAGDNLTILGKRLAISNQLPSNLTKGTSSGVCSALVYGNWSDVVIGEWGVLEILPNPYDANAYQSGAVLIRAMQSVDIGVRHAASFSAMTDALTV